MWCKKPMNTPSSHTTMNQAQLDNCRVCDLHWLLKRTVHRWSVYRFPLPTPMRHHHQLISKFLYFSRQCANSNSSNTEQIRTLILSCTSYGSVSLCLFAEKGNPHPLIIPLQHNRKYSRCSSPLFCPSIRLQFSESCPRGNGTDDTITVHTQERY